MCMEVCELECMCVWKYVNLSVCMHGVFPVLSGTILRIIIIM